MGGLEPDQAEPIGLIVGWRQCDTGFGKLFAMNVLELSLDKLYCIVVFEFSHKEDNKVKHLLHLNSVDLCLVSFFLEGGDHGRESQIGKCLDSLE